MNGDPDVELDDDKCDEQLALIELIKEAVVLLSDSTWKVVPVLFEMKCASAIGPPIRLVLNESPYCEYEVSVNFWCEKAIMLLHDRGDTALARLQIPPKPPARTRTEILGLRHQDRSTQDIRYHTFWITPEFLSIVHDKISVDEPCTVHLLSCSPSSNAPRKKLSTGDGLRFPTSRSV